MAVLEVAADEQASLAQDTCSDGVAGRRSPSEFEQEYHFCMADSDFPDDLRTAQTRLHQATSELAALTRRLFWSVEPMAGWPGTEHPHTGEVTGGREASPGWTTG
jgi:hypothetical protein